MANSEVSRLKFNNTTYDIADELARQNIGVARSEIATEAARLDAVDTGLAGRITNLENSAGAVLVAKTKSAMSDTSKIYVYTGSESGMTRGNWYYHNGSAWVSGGAYNQNLDAIDATLTQSNKGADAKVTGDRLTAAESDISKLRGTIANEYTSQAYAVGDYCYYNGLLYRCNTAISVGETWTSSHWTAVDVMPELNNLKNDLDAVELSIFKSNKTYPSNWTIPGGIHPDTGANGGSFAAGKARTGYNSATRPMVVKFDTERYSALIWGYEIVEGTGVPVKSYTSNTFVADYVTIPAEENVTSIRICLKRNDNQSMTSDTSDPDSDASIIPSTTYFQFLTDNTLTLSGGIADAKSVGDEIAENRNSQTQFFEKYSNIIDGDRLFEVGGTFRPYLEQGSANFTSGVLTPTVSVYRARTPVDKPLILPRGAVVNSGNIYVAITNAIKTVDGYTRGQYLVAQFSKGSFTVQSDGFYTLLLQNAPDDDTRTPMTALEAMEEVSITFPVSKSKSDVGQSFVLLNNPYANIAKKKNTDTGAITWSDRVHDIVSTCHLHTPHAYNFRRAVNKGYEHLALSNYHAAKPTIPIREVLPFLPDYNSDLDVVPEGWLESPNAEHAYFTDSAKYVGSSNATHLHLNSVGSYVSSGTDNTGAGEGGYDGTVSDFMNEAIKMLKYTNGGGVTINHPKWSEITADGVKAIIGAGPVFAMEIFNGSAEAQNGKGYSLDIWDSVLSEGIQIYGVAVPDHVSEGVFDWQNIPWGYNHMLCIEKTEQNIMLAYRNGQFYTTIYNDDLKLTYYGISSGTVTIRVSKASTIIFTTATRSVTVNNASEATLDTQDGDTYVRAEAQADNNRLFTNAIIL